MISAPTGSKPLRETLDLAREEDLELLRRGLRRRRSVRVFLALPLPVADASRARLERSINRNLAACGCNEGTVAGLLYLVLVPTVVMGRYVPHSTLTWALAACGFIAALVIGKGIGLALAHLRLQWTLNEIRRLTLRRTEGS
jgi:hypothetical protein